MGQVLRLLQIEDSECDAELVVRLLEKAHYDVRAMRVEDGDGLRAALAQQAWDVIVADYHLPQYSAPAALKTLQEAGEDIPFIVVSGNLGENLAVEMMRAGAHDYLMKNNLARLAPAVERELREAAGRQKRRRAEEALRNSQDRLAAIIDNAMDGIITVDEGQRVVLFNTAAENIFGCAATDVIGTPLDRFLPVRYREIHRGHIQTYGTDGSPRSMHALATLYGLRANGEEFPLEATISQAVLGGQKLFTVILRDITRRKQAEETERLYSESKELDRLKTEFFANISHELRTPLALILGPVQKLRAAGGWDDGERQDLELIERNARSLLKEVNDLLDFSKLDAGRMCAAYSEMDLARLVRLVASNFDSVATERGVAFVVEAPGPLQAQIDAPKIERVLLNLLSNAIKFTPAGGQVRVALHQSGDRAILEVEDTGPGIPPHLRECVFERFRQLEGGADRRFGGTGLGLSIVRQFVNLHGGSIAVVDAPGHTGSVFRVALPLVAPAGAQMVCAAEGVPLEAASQALEELRAPRPAHRTALRATPPGAPVVLLVEDNPDMNAFIAEALSPPYRVVCAFDGREGLEKALEAPPDLILSDIMMPRMSGDRMVREMRTHPELEEVPIILLTAKADEDLRVRLLREGAQDYLHKPFDAPAVLAKVDRFITDARRRRETEAALHRLSGSLLQVRDQERRAVAQELHENTAQCLAALQINLHLARTDSLDPAVQEILGEGYALLEQCISDLRTITYGLHPPLLEHLGLRAAMEWHLQGFTKASGIQVGLNIARDLKRLPTEWELALFRVMQEALLNLQCHPGIGAATVHVYRDACEAGVDVSAQGWPAAEPAAELGIAAMRERVRKLGGRLDILPEGEWTVVRATLPLPPAEP